MSSIVLREWQESYSRGLVLGGYCVLDSCVVDSIAICKITEYYAIAGDDLNESSDQYRERSVAFLKSQEVETASRRASAFKRYRQKPVVACIQ